MRHAIAAMTSGDGGPAVAACAVEITAAGSSPADVRLLPAGSFRSWDGRPTDAPAWVLNAADGARLVAEAAARTSDRVIDYEHATLHRAKAKGEKAPAAGWFRKLEWRADGLWALGVQWTAQAARHIAEREYRYLSPVFSYDEASGRVLSLLHASLTNDPGLDGLTDLAALAAELFATPPNQEQPMPELLKKLLAELGLQETATEAEALAAAADLKTNVASLSAKVALPPDGAAWVPMSVHAEVQRELAALRASIDGSKHTALMSAALADGRILPATEAYWRSQPLAVLSAYLEVAQPVAALSGMQSGGKNPDAGAGAAIAFSVPGGYGVDSDRLALHRKVLAHASANKLPYDQALTAVISTH